MAAQPPPLLPHPHARAVLSAPLRTPSRFFIPGDQVHSVCQSSSPRWSVYASASCNVCLHEGSTPEVRVPKPSSSKVESISSEDCEALTPSTLAESRLDGASTFGDLAAGKTSFKEIAGSRIKGASGLDEACTNDFTAAADPRCLTGSGSPSEDVIERELCSTSYGLPVSNSSALPNSSGAVESPQGLSPASAASPQTRSKVVRTAWEALVRWSRSWQLLNARKATNVLQKTRKVVVIGGGSFGTAMAVLLARNKSEMQVSLLLRDSTLCESINSDHVNRNYFPKHTLPQNIVATVNPQEAFKDSEYCIHAVPVQYSADLLKSIAEHVPPGLPFFSVSKGLELSTLEMMSQVIPRALGNQRQPIAVISGPSFSIELMDELPTAMVVASKDKELARAAQQLLASRYLRINTSSDIVGVEIAGALKNVLAIAAGIVEGMNLGNNCMAALVAQGCSEIRWLAEKMGAKSTTLAGLSGTGDIMLTCFVNLSRNRSVGVRLGSGESLGDILSSMNQVAEGVATAGAVIALARKYRVQMPVLTAVARILENELTPKKAVLELMSLPQVEEV